MMFTPEAGDGDTSNSGSAKGRPSGPTTPTAPPGVDIGRPAASRVYDYFLGGGHNFEADRDFGNKMIQTLPVIRELVRNNRRFLRHAVEYCVSQGISQFLDIGSGVPTVGNVHEVAHRVDPSARVVYVDHEPVAHAHAELLVQQKNIADRVTVVQEDFCSLESVLDHPETRRLINFSEPVALLAVALLHFIPDSAGPSELLAAFRRRLAPGSLLALSHIAGDEARPEQREQVERFVAAYQDTCSPVYLRTRQQVRRLFAGWDLVPPGVVRLPDWNSADNEFYHDAARDLGWCGAGRLS